MRDHENAAADAHHDDYRHHSTGWRRWVFSTNHMDIGTMYLIFAIIMGLVGGILSLMFRLELSAPGM